MKLIKLNHFAQDNTKLHKDVMNTIGSMCSLNAPGAIGYLFNPDEIVDQIYDGMYCDSISEIDIKRWTYYLSYEDKTFYKIT